MSPVSRKTGKRFAAGSRKGWNGWETRVCAVCGVRITLGSGAEPRNHGMHSWNGGRSFSLCGLHVSFYGQFALKEAA